MSGTKLYYSVTEARVCVNNLPRSLPRSGPAGTRTLDLSSRKGHGIPVNLYDFEIVVTIQNANRKPRDVGRTHRLAVRTGACGARQNVRNSSNKMPSC